MPSSHLPRILADRKDFRADLTRCLFSQLRSPFNSAQTPRQPLLSKGSAAEQAQAPPQSPTPQRSPQRSVNRPRAQKFSVSESSHSGPCSPTPERSPSKPPTTRGNTRAWRKLGNGHTDLLSYSRNAQRVTAEVYFASRTSSSTRKISL
jgi:hypothetical protein